MSWENQGELVLNFSLDDYRLETFEADGQVFSRLRFEGNVWTRQRGFAELPIIAASIQLPAEGNFAVEILADDYDVIKLDHPMLPSKGVIYRNQNPGEIPYWIDPAAEALRLYPESLAEHGNPFIYRDIRGMTVFVSPFQYQAKDGKLMVHHTVRLALTPRRNQDSINPLLDRGSRLTREMDTAYASLFLNYDRQAQEPRFAHELAEMGEMLVIYTSRDATAIQPYLAWKRQNGYKVHTQEVATGTNVKTTIQNAYNANPNLLYVQLVGDWADIKSDLGTSSSAPTDPMLGCVAGSDNFADLIIGRFPAASAAEVTLMINKAINYEKYPSGTWYTYGLGIGSSEGSGSGDDGEIDYAHIDVIKENKLLPYSWTSVTEAYGSPSDATVADAVNAGLSVINYCGHGSDTSWVTSGFNNADVNALTNGAMLPVIYSVACVNGTFHKTSECFAEAWLRKSGGGAVATVMATINQPWQPPMRGQDYMNDLLTGGYDYAAGPGNGTSTTAGKTTFGSTVFNGMVLMYAESAGSDDLDTIKTWTIFGDASLQVRTAESKALQVTHDGALLLGHDQFDVNVQTSARAAVAGARVYAASSSQPAVTAFGVTDASGNVTLTFATPPSETGTLNITVTGYNLTPYLGTAEIIPGQPCDPPANFGVVNAGDNDVLLTWDASAHADGGYQVYRSTTGCTGSFTLVSTPAGSPWHDTTVSGGITYHYKVRSVCGGYGGITYTTCLGVEAEGDCLLAPTFAGVTAIEAPTEQTCQLVVHWNAGTSNCPSYPVLEYDVYRAEVSGGPYDAIATGVSGVSYADLNVEGGHVYYYVVRAVDGGGNEDENVTEKSGSPLGPIIVALSDDMEGTEPNGWSHSAANGADDWQYSTTRSHSATHAWFTSNPNTIKDGRLLTPSFEVTGAAELSFWHYYNVEGTYDGCVLEISTDGGSTFADLNAKITQNGYNGTVSTGYQNPLAGRPAWTGDSAAWKEVLVDLADYEGLTVILRFRIGTDSLVADEGWYIDDVVVSQSSACDGNPEVPGDLNKDLACDSLDAVILSHYLSACIQHGEGGFTASASAADLDHNLAIEAVDLVLMLLML